MVIQNHGKRLLRYFSIYLWLLSSKVIHCSNLDRVLCLHGGLSPNVPFIDSIGLIERVREIPETGPMSDLVWSDPDSHLTTWAVSNRGAGYLFPHQAVK